MQTLEDMGEIEAIRRLTARLPLTGAIALGPGDDCAVVTCGEDDLVLTSDPVIAGIHFDKTARPQAVGHKAVGRALSDLAAMGATPTCALVNIVAPRDTSATYLEDVYNGLSALATRFDLSVAGGDLAEGPNFELHVFALGKVPRGTAVTRSGASPGDSIYVTGALGYSSQGGHLSFTPRVAEGAWLREGGWASAMIDISDGLATDLRHLVECSAVGARLNACAIPLRDASTEHDDRRSSLQHALDDGEDFELLFTLPSGKSDAFDRSWRKTFELPCSRVGEVTLEAGEIVIVDQSGVEHPHMATGYEHFRTEP